MCGVDRRHLPTYLLSPRVPHLHPGVKRYTKDIIPRVVNKEEFGCIPERKKLVICGQKNLGSEICVVMQRCECSEQASYL